MAGQRPDALQTAIKQAYQQLAVNAVAVRSSATAEDLPDASFAGQQDSFLNITDEEALFKAIKPCWASLWSARAIDYRARRDIAPDQVALAIVVQQMVPTDASGILFTANPTNGDRTHMVINETWGLGEAIVSGRVVSDTFIVNRQTGVINELHLGEKSIMTIPTNNDIREQPVAEVQQGVRVLDDDMVANLVRLASKVEAVYGSPQDIEWCLYDGTSSIVQNRPITALPDPVNWSSPFEGQVLRSGSIIEFITEPVSPLMATLVAPILEQITYK